MSLTSMNRTAISLSLLFLLSAFQPVTGQSQNQPTRIDTGEVYQLGEIIISANRWAEDPRTVGRNVSVINRREIENSVSQSVGDLLAGSQSLHMVGTNQAAGSIQSVFLRQTSSNHTVVMIDGVRISDPSTVNNSPDLSELSLANVERIEIVRGSHSTLYGSSAIGGAINIITRDRGPAGFNGTVSTSHGLLSNSNYTTTNRADLNYSLESGLYINLGLAQEYSQGIDATIDTTTGGFNSQDNDGFEKLDLSGKVGYKTEKLDLYAAYRNEDQWSSLDQSAFQDDDNAQIDFGRHLIRLGGEYQPSGGWRIGYRGAYSETNRFFVNDSSIVDASGSYDGVYTETRGTGTLLDNEVTAGYKTGAFHFVAGAGNQQQTMNSRSLTYSSAFNLTNETDLDSLNLKEITNYLFIQGEVNGGLINNKLEAFTLGLGGRLTDHNQFGSHYTFEITPKIQVAENALLYGSLSTGYNAPSLFQLHAPQQGVGALTNRGNPNLDPETSVSYEIGWKQQAGNNLRFDLSLYRTEVSDVIQYVYLWDDNTPVSNLGFGDYLGDTYLNLSRQKIDGVELGVSGSIRKLRFDGSFNWSRSSLTVSPGDINTGYTSGNHVQIFESGAFIDGKEEIDGLTRRPSVTASLNVQYRVNSRLQLNVKQQYVGGRDDLYYSSALGPFGALDRESLQEYYLLDLGAGYELTRRLDLRLRINNLLDNEYTEIRGFSTRGRSAFLKVSYHI